MKQYGTVNVSGGTVRNYYDSADGTAIQVIDVSGTVSITGGKVESNGTGVAVSEGQVNISGTGTVAGGSYGIKNAGNAQITQVAISGGTVTRMAPAPTDDTEVLPGYAVSRPFTFTGGKLRAKNSDCFCDIELSMNISEEKDSEGYYTATPEL